MKYLSILVVFVLLVGCKSNRSEYHRGYFNAMAIIQKRGLVKEGIDRTDWPYWEECERSYLQKIDLYNDWDSSYGLFDNKYIKGEHALATNVFTSGIIYQPKMRYFMVTYFGADERGNNTYGYFFIKDTYLYSLDSLNKIVYKETPKSAVDKRKFIVMGLNEFKDSIDYNNFKNNHQ